MSRAVVLPRPLSTLAVAALLHAARASADQGNIVAGFLSEMLLIGVAILVALVAFVWWLIKHR